MAINNEDKEEKRRRVEKLRELKFLLNTNRSEEWASAINRAIEEINKDLSRPNHISDLAPFIIGRSLPKEVYESIERTQLDRELSVKPQRIFLSYAHEDVEKVDELYKYLLDRNHKPWMDVHDLLPGQNWKSTITKMISESDYFIAFFSEKALGKRGFFQREIKLGLETMSLIPEGQIFFIPIIIGDVEIPPSIEELHYVDINTDRVFEKILLAIECQTKASNKLD